MERRQLLELLRGSFIFISNDYELELTCRKTGRGVEELLPLTRAVITTRGEQGALLLHREDGVQRHVIPAVKPLVRHADPKVRLEALAVLLRLKDPDAVGIATLCTLLTAACGTNEHHAPPSWQLLRQDEPAALLSIWGTDVNDVWVVGGRTELAGGPTVLRNRDGWARVDVGHTNLDLWWVFGPSADDVFFGGTGGTIFSDLGAIGSTAGFDAAPGGTPIQ